MLALGLLPQLLGTRWIYQPIVDQLAADNFRLQIASVKLRWLSPLRFEGVELSETSGQSLLSISEVKTDRGLLRYMLGGRKLGRIEIVRPTINVELLKDGSNLDRIIQSFDKANRTGRPTGKKPPAVDIAIAVRQFSAKVVGQSNGNPLVVIPPLDADISYRAAEGDSHVMVAPTKVLDQVELTQELIEIGLGHAVPLIAQSLWFDGRVSMSVSEIDIPLSRPHASRGKIVLTLHEVRSGPADENVRKLLDLVATMRQQEPQHELIFVDGSQVLVSVADNRVHHEGLRFGLPKLDNRLQMATSGFVGLEDQTLEMIIEVPVPVEHLAKRESVQKLGVPTLKLPVGGTLDKPVVRWDALRGEAGQLLAMMRQRIAGESPATATVLGALEGLAEGNADEAISAAVDLVKQIRQRRQSTDKPENSGPDEGQASEKKRPVIDALREALRRRKS